MFETIKSKLLAAQLAVPIALCLTLAPISQAQDAATLEAQSEAAVEFTPLTEAQVTELFQNRFLIGEDPAEYTPEEMVNAYNYIAESNAFLDGLTPQTGTINIKRHSFKLNLGEDFIFYNADDSNKILVDRWGNLEDSTTLGMVFAKGTDPEYYDYAIEVSFTDDGYVSDKEASKLNYDKMLKKMQKQTDAESKERLDLGMESISLVGWAQEPKYDATTKRLYWAKLLNFGGADSNTLNYNLRMLGRKGVLQFNFIADETALEVVNKDIDEVAKIAQFHDGYKYADFNPETDKEAAYGIGGLIVGAAVAKKLGLFGVLLVFLKKGWILIFAAFAFMGKFFKKKDKTVPTIPNESTDRPNS